MTYQKLAVAIGLLTVLLVVPAVSDGYPPALSSNPVAEATAMAALAVGVGMVLARLRRRGK